MPITFEKIGLLKLIGILHTPVNGSNSDLFQRTEESYYVIILLLYLDWKFA